MTVLSFVSKLGRGGRRRKGTPAQSRPGTDSGMKALEERSLSHSKISAIVDYDASSYCISLSV